MRDEWILARLSIPHTYWCFQSISGIRSNRRPDIHHILTSENLFIYFNFLTFLQLLASLSFAVLRKHRTDQTQI